MTFRKSEAGFSHLVVTLARDKATVTLYSVHCILYNKYTPLTTVNRTLYTLHFTLYTLYNKLYTVNCIVYIVHFTLFIPHSTLYTLHTIHCRLYTLCKKYVFLMFFGYLFISP